MDALGNTTAATGKGFAIGSAALTALALLASYIEEIKIAIARIPEKVAAFTEFAQSNSFQNVDVHKASIPEMMQYLHLDIMNPRVLVGCFIGSMAAFLFCGLTMNAVGRAAQKMVEEVRRQFREIKGILTGEGEPDYARCVEISTKGRTEGNVIPVATCYFYSDCYRFDIRCFWSCWFAFRRYFNRVHPCYFYGQFRWCMGQC